MNFPADLTSTLSALPHVEAPADLAAAVMARVARLEDETPAGHGTSRHDWSGWVALGGMVVGMAVVLPTFAVSVDFSSILGGRGAAGLAVMPETAAGIATLVVGSATYLAGLLMPLRAGRAVRAR